MVYFVPNRNFVLIVLLIVLLCLGVVSPLVAQEGMTVTVPPDGGNGGAEIGLLIPDDWMPMIGAFGAAFIVLFGTALFALYKSSPPLVQGTISTIINFLLKMYEAKAKLTPNTADDDRAKRIRELLFEQGYLDEADYFERLLTNENPNDVPGAVG